MDSLNASQVEAAGYGVGQGGGPLVIIAGAGSGKTRTLAHRVAALILAGADPARVLLLTFTRRAAAEMTRRAQQLVQARQKNGRGLLWSGTFHAVGNKLLRLHSQQVGLDAAFTVLDRSDAADLMDFERTRLGFQRAAERFPRKDTCLAIYSRVLNAQKTLEVTLREAFPWCVQWAPQLRELFRAYTDAKQRRSLLDYDDLLLYWFHLLSNEAAAAHVGSRFDHILVDEYQDTNALQAAILLRLKPSGAGLTVVGDDAQSIYSFRGATVRNILDFPAQFSPLAKVITLCENYRSTQAILDSANAVIGLARERYTKDLSATREGGRKPLYVTVEDEALQVGFVVEKILEHREAGLQLKQQAVLFRTAHHSDALEVELARRNIPFVKYGGLKFLEAAHIKDMLSVLRWAENPKDNLAALRLLKLLPGVGNGVARRAFEHVEAEAFAVSALAKFAGPKGATAELAALAGLIGGLAGPVPWAGQLTRIRQWYQPHLERLYDDARQRASDLDQLEQLSTQYQSREQFLSELTLDPPEATGTQAGPPLLDEDYLILSTIHSAKGQEWSTVFVLNVADGCIPSDMSTGDAEQIEEERRLLYVAMTRAKDDLYLVHPLRMFVRQQARYGDKHLYTPVSRFLPEPVLAHFDRQAVGRPVALGAAATPALPVTDVAALLRAQWQ